MKPTTQQIDLKRTVCNWSFLPAYPTVRNFHMFALQLVSQFLFPDYHCDPSQIEQQFHVPVPIYSREIIKPFILTLQFGSMSKHTGGATRLPFRTKVTQPSITLLTNLSASMFTPFIPISSKLVPIYIYLPVYLFLRSWEPCIPELFSAQLIYVLWILSTLTKPCLAAQNTYL